MTFSSQNGPESFHAWRFDGRKWRVSVMPPPMHTSCVSRSWPSTNSGIGSALGTMMLPVAVERSVSPALLVIDRSSAELAGPSWMAGRCTRGPFPYPQGMDMASVHSALGSGYGDTNLTSRLLANVANISICGSPHLANMGRRLSMAIVHSVVSVWPTLDRESAWMLRTPGRWTGTNVIALLSHHLSSRMVICIKVCDLVPPSFLMYATVTALSHHTVPQMR